MEKKWWAVILVFVALLSVISVFNITGFAITTPNTEVKLEPSASSGDTESNTNDVESNAPVQVQFPGGSSNTPNQQHYNQVGDSGSDDGDESQAVQSQSGDFPDEFHTVCSQQLCVVVEGPGDTACDDNSDCESEPVCGDGYCDPSSEDEVTCLDDCPIGGGVSSGGDDGDDSQTVNDDGSSGSPVPAGDSSEDATSESSGSENNRESSGSAPVRSNPALGEQGDLSDEEFQDYLDNSYATCTNKFDQCVRIPKVAGDESDICGLDRSCEDIKRALDEKAAEDFVQLSSSNDLGLIARLLKAVLGTP
jgi:hypothetical protein